MNSASQEKGKERALELAEAEPSEGMVSGFPKGEEAGYSQKGPEKTKADDWMNITDPTERRRQQNKHAQRRFRK